MKIRDLHRNIDNWNTQKVLDIIYERCHIITAAMNSTGLVLDRGIVGSESAVFLGNSPQNRPPRNTHKKFHDRIEKNLKAAGFKARRNNSIFVLGAELGMPSAYGSNYIIFPFDGFNYTWCMTAKDLTSQFDLDVDPESDSQLSSAGTKFRGDMFHMDPNTFCFEYGFHQNIGLEEAMTGRYEIYIQGRYLALRVETAEERSRVYSSVLEEISPGIKLWKGVRGDWS